MPMSILYVKTERNREYSVSNAPTLQRRRDPDVVQKHASGSQKTAGKLSRHRLFLVNISIYLDKFMFGGTEMLY